MGRKVGLIKPGYAADIDLLDANPLEDIANTKKLSGVLQGGLLHDRKELDAMLAKAKRAGS
jgi:imidazolonepropionase-like amidohydrolase